MAQDGDGLAILRRAAAYVPPGSAWRERLDAALTESGRVGVHLGVFVEPYLAAILDGRKTIESRFGVHRCTPFERVRRGDVILLKQSGGPVVGLALAGEANYYELDSDVLDGLRERFAVQLYAQDDEFWSARATKRYASLIGIEDTVRIEALTVQKRDRRGWVTFLEGRQACLEPLD